MAASLTERAIDRTLELLYRHGYTEILDHPRPELRRVRAGHWQRAAGAWSWYLFPYLWCGSCYPAHRIAKAKHIGLYFHPYVHTAEVIIEDEAP